MKIHFTICFIVLCFSVCFCVKSYYAAQGCNLKPAEIELETDFPEIIPAPKRR
jgi:hypothetical protein